MMPTSVEPLLFVIFGATGDLTRRKLLPALYNLVRQGYLKRSAVLGTARAKDIDSEGFRDMIRDVVPPDWSSEHVYYCGLGEGADSDFRRLILHIESIEARHHLTGNRIFYLGVPPLAFGPLIEGLARFGLNHGRGRTRIVIEKPFGRDYASARELDESLHRYFDESQIFRIDHYLGKETVQNLLVMRFANPVFEHSWNRDRVDNVQITVAEDLGIENRAAYYDETGALRDMVQNHLTQVLSLLAMETPPLFEAEAIRDEKVKVLKSVAPLTPEQVVFGQYAGYREEPGVPKDSKTETAVALKMEIANWRWQGVPFYLRTGKRMGRRAGRIVVVFRCAPVSVFEPLSPDCSVHPNALDVSIQQDEGFDLYFEVKHPGQPIRIETEKLHFRYAEEFPKLPDAYETLLLDVMRGDQTLFVRSDFLELSWKLYEPALKSPPPVHCYRPGTPGPPEFDRLLAADGRRWFLL
jgi:glucose-6-phosphate 1-dehydrogenase